LDKKKNFSEMSGFEALSKPLKPRSAVAVHTLHPTLEQKPRAKYSVPDWFNHKYIHKRTD